MPRPAGAGRSVTVVGLGVALVAAAFLVTIVVWRPTTGSGWQLALYQLASVTWPVLGLTALLLVSYEHFLRHRLSAELAGISGPRIVEALLPQQVMEATLSAIYGPNEANRDVVAGVLGGEGLRPQGGDLTISTHTTVHYQLRAIDHSSYHLTSTVGYSFKENVAVDRFVIFATCNALLRDSIGSGCRMPLFEHWFVPDQPLFQQSVDDMLRSVQIRISYIDRTGLRQHAESSRARLQEVKFNRWPEYLSFFREPMGPLPRQDTRDYLGDLRIFECDLSNIAEDEHPVSSIERLKLRSTVRQRIDDGSCYWQSPYPCYVERITIDANELSLDNTSLWEFKILPFTFRSSTTSARWLPPEKLGDLEVRSWLLPGHGFALLWRSATSGQDAEIAAS